MIRRLRVGARRGLLFAFLISLLAHFFGAAFFNPLVRPRILIAGDPERITVATTTLSLEQRPKQPQSQPAPQKHRRTLPRTIPNSAASARAVEPRHSAPARRHELAKIVAYAPPAPKETHAKTDDEGAQLAADQAKFAKTLAHLRSTNDPIATQQQLATAAGGGTKRFGADFSSVPDTKHGGEGYLAPVKSWKDGPYTYYYLRYDVVYPDGSRESGYVPWPVRYFPGNDPFVHGQPPYRMPLPLPLADFVPPADDMKPLVAFCYRHRTELVSCPIQHD